MDNLRKTIKLLFEGIDPDKVLSSSNLDSNYKNNSNYTLNKSTFKDTAFAQYTFDNNSVDEILNVYRKVNEDWSYSADKNNGKKSPFYLLTHFTKQVLTDEGKEPFVVYEHLLKWRDVTLEIGEDVLSSSHLAYCDVISNRNRPFLSWRPVLFSNNKRLKKILDQGVAENHSHINASSLNFDINWIALMNKHNGLLNEVDYFINQSRLYGRATYQFDTEKIEIKTLLKKAVVLRLIIFKIIEFYKEFDDSKGDLIGTYFKNEVNFNLNFLLNNSNSLDSIDLHLNFDKIVNHINSLGQFKSLKLPHSGNLEFYDYAAEESMHPENFSGCYFLYGERSILYYAFKNLYQRLESSKDTYFLEKFLHSYLLIKNIFRRELVQLNRRIGFGNFKDYQDRKTLFIKENSIYSTFFYDISLNYFRKLMKIKSNELRFGPREDVLELKKEIEKFIRIRNYSNTEKYWKKYLLGTNNPLKYINEFEENKTKENTEELFFVLHFFKRQDSLFINKNQSDHRTIIKQKKYSRDYALRNKVKADANSIVKLRESFPELSCRVRGIDAASSEIFARPEVFGQAFRYLKNHLLKQKEASIKGIKNVNPLRITFHAGEDFFDIADGMRYIDECLRFLGMSQGDRFGHALAIGIDVKSYYSLKGRKLIISKHMILDNVSWLLAKARKFGFIEHLSEIANLENLFKNLFSEIYLNSNVTTKLNSITYHDYYDAWKLRGDDPKLYYDLINNTTMHSDPKSYFDNIRNLDYWDRCRLNDSNYKLKNIRNRSEISNLYYEYHYNPLVKNKGNEMKQFEITDSYIKLVESVQKCMMEIIVNKNIAIETNPTSNYLIGTISRYADHPITKWYNLGLENEIKKIQESPQISVSINTDDAGIFSTTLENEFALMAIALEKEKDESGNPKYKKSMIYDWLDKVRMMGIEQSFK